MTDSVETIMQRIFARAEDLRAARAQVRALEQEDRDDIERLKQEVQR